MVAFYNELDPYAAQWLRNLIDAGMIAPGVVDERDIRDIRPADLAGYTQCHFFAGIGVWSYALRQAGWPDDRPVWTGSCPCQPFSVAGQRRGSGDERHLWPAWLRLIETCKPPVIFGEQVASSDVVGKSLQKMRRGKINDGVPSAQQGRPAWGVPRLREPSGQGDEALEFGAEEILPSRAQENSPGLCFGERCEAAGNRETDTVRSGLAGHTGADQLRVLRSDGASVLPLGAEILGRPVSGSEDTERGVYEREHARCALRAEHDGKHMGGGSDPEDCGRNSGETVFSRAERFIRENRRGSHETTSPAWIDTVHIGLATAGYTIGFAVLPACGAGSPHIRQRLFFVAHAKSERLQRRQDDDNSGRGQRASGQGSPVVELGDADKPGLEGRCLPERGRADECASWAPGDPVRPGPTNGFWSNADWLGCTDGKWRPAFSGSFPLVDGSAFRMGSGSPFAGKSRAKMLRGYGNAIVAPLAAEFIASVMECVDDQVD